MLCEKCNCEFNDKYLYKHRKKCDGSKKIQNKNLNIKIPCVFCNKMYTKNYIHLHQRTCEKNPNAKCSWNKGLTKDSDERVLKNTITSKNTKNTDEWKQNHISWNKGLTKDSDKRVLKNAIHMKNTKNTDEWKYKTLQNIYKKYNRISFYTDRRI
mgnify:CR=1 FL=1